PRSICTTAPRRRWKGGTPSWRSGRSTTGSSGSSGRAVRSPAAPARDLALALAQRGLTEHAEHFLAVAEPHLADAEPRRLLEQDLAEAGVRHVPDLHRDGRAALAHPDHRRMAVLDGPEAIVGRGGRLAHEARADGEEVAVQGEAAHQRAIHGE